MNSLNCQIESQNLHFCESVTIEEMFPDHLSDQVKYVVCESSHLRARLLCAGLLHFKHGARNVHTPQYAAVQFAGIRVLARAAPFLELVVDVSYQREIGRRGATNVNQIAENFDWSKFAPVIVAPVVQSLMASTEQLRRCFAARRKFPVKSCKPIVQNRPPLTLPSTAILRRQPLNSSIMRSSQQKTPTL
jgi:hypothetical protein